MRPISRSNPFKWIVFISFFSFQTMAAVHPKQQQAEEIITKLYHSLSYKPSSTMAERLEIISAQFLGAHYELGALGEGDTGRFDAAPLYRTDSFDCDTYVTTVLSLALSTNPQSFTQCLAKVRYKGGKVDFITRNHFTSLDWNPNNQQQGFIKDITATIKDKNQKPLVEVATARIDKSSWYQHLSPKAIRLLKANETIQKQRLAELQALGSAFSPQNASLPYLPLEKLFDAKGNPETYLFVQIPHGAIIEIVRPNWNIHEKIGTNLNVSHLGFAFWKQGVLYFRQASSQYGHVVDVPLIDYLRDKLTSPTIKGINLEVVVPEKPICQITQ
ncbi:MAG: N-acetylmuramoyl-L-alanine amidase-like domain-containing protein [Tatlockia sp.]|jgi:hypothetical protein